MRGTTSPPGCALESRRRANEPKIGHSGDGSNTPLRGLSLATRKVPRHQRQQGQFDRILARLPDSLSPWADRRHLGAWKGMLIAFRNKSAATCVLQGYPKVVATRPGMSSVATASPSTYIGGLQPGALPPLVRLKSGNESLGRSRSRRRAARPVSSPCVHQRYKTVTVSLPSQSGSKRLSASFQRKVRPCRAVRA